MASHQKPLISMRSSNGLVLMQSNDNDFKTMDKFNNFQDESKNCRISAFSSQGNLFSFCNNQIVKVIKTDTCETILSIDKPRTSWICFSPNGNYLVLWEPFYITKQDPIEHDNLSVYEIKSSKLIKSFLQKKQLENYVQWSNDEKLLSLIVNSEIRIYEMPNFDTYVNHIAIEGLEAFSINSQSKCIAVHIKGKSNQPSAVRLFQYPHVKTVLLNKAFFNADRVEIKWNKTGHHLLLLCSTETSANSYYGDTTLHYMNIKGESQNVDLAKKGPIYSLEWNSQKDEFVVVYGNMPAKATLFNFKCEAVYDFGTGPRNECYFNTLGNIVCLCGFGNLRGRIEVWYLGSKVPEQVCSIAADDTTYFEWSPDGEHILTATTAPRLRVSNGFKIWDYTGERKYVFDMPLNGELWQVQWQKGAQFAAKNFVLRRPKVVQEEAKAYVPPHLRGKQQQSSSKPSKLHADDDEKPDTKLKAKKALSAEEELEKKIKNVKKRLQQIDELKNKQTSGVKLETNQLDKIKNEKHLLDELEALELRK